MAFSLFNWFLFLIWRPNLFCGSTPDTHNFLASVTCVKIKLCFFFACHVSFLPLTICHHSPGCPCGSSEHGSSMWLVLVCENQQATCHENSFPGLFKETESNIHQHPHASQLAATSEELQCLVTWLGDTTSGHISMFSTNLVFDCGWVTQCLSFLVSSKGIIPSPPTWERPCEA